VRIQRQPLLQHHLTARNLTQQRAFARPHYGFTVGLSPPAAGAHVLEHGVEVIHAHEPEILRLLTHTRTVHASGATHGAVRHEHVFTADRVAQVMMVADHLQRVGTCLAVYFDPHHEPIERHRIAVGLHELHHGGRQEHRISRHTEVHHPRDDGGHEQPRQELRVARPRRCLAEYTDGPQCHERGSDASHHPSRRPQHVRKVQTAHALAPRHGHDEVHGEEESSHA